MLGDRETMKRRLREGRELASLGGYGPRVAESGLGLIPSMAASAPYEDLKLKGK